jgi:hypothetical protein
MSEFERSSKLPRLSAASTAHRSRRKRQSRLSRRSYSLSLKQYPGFLASPTHSQGPLRSGMTADPDVVGRIQEGRIDRSIVADDLAKEVNVAAIAATNAMLATNPDIAETGAGLGWSSGNRLVVRNALRGQQHIDLAGRKPVTERSKPISSSASSLSSNFRRSRTRPRALADK